MKKISIAFVCVTALLTFAGCKKGNSSGDALAKFSSMADKMCGCKDKACADGVQAEYTKWGEEQAKNASGDKAAKMSDEDTKKFADVTKKYGDCMMKASGAPDPAASAAPPPADKPADPAAAPADKPADPAAAPADKPADKPADPAAAPADKK
jgi:hypothetical protein